MHLILISCKVFIGVSRPISAPGNNIHYIFKIIRKLLRYFFTLLEIEVTLFKSPEIKLVRQHPSIKGYILA
jgi:hypothetical protein